MVARKLLSIVELGGYPNFESLYRTLGFEHHSVNSGRRAIATLKQLEPAVVVAEFNFQRDFRDRTSSLESILATVQNRMPTTRVIVFYHEAEREPLDRLRGRFPFLEPMARPIDEGRLRELLAD